MSWTHSICDECWITTNGQREAHRLREPEYVRCCRCAAWSSSGIYVRADPATLRCAGRHD